MKKGYTLFFVMLTIVTFSQQIAIRGLVIDAATKEPVISASIGIENSGMGTITNEDGVFQLTANKTATIVMTYLGYKTLKMSAAEFGTETKTIALEQDNEILEEVMVTKIPLYQILAEVLTVSKARFNKPILLHTYYREFAKTNDRYTQFSDGMLDFHMSGGTKTTKSDLIVKQNRSFDMAAEEDKDESGSFLDVRRAVSSGYEFDYLKTHIINEKHYDNYDFQLKSRKDKSGNELFAISFDPKIEVEKPLYKGTIIYDPSSKLVYDIDLELAPTHKQYARTMNLLFIKFSYLDSRYKVAYKLVNNNYLMSFNNRFNKFKAWNKKRSYIWESRSDLIVTDFEKDDQTYNKKEIYNERDLFSKPTHYTEKFWQKNNAIVLTAEEERIVSALENAVASDKK